eukprot:CAMPEP_0172361236 /NCGR_PEP_ID=MMETSP1060-20121228/5098_1 /TAXON_ID=37318 /ORGANISM="Pseudo-nitzschia pungens, Strain cf. cingulata" /LENGTH=708 /DNA_ID=CAMNT_0013083439 /DNA_START=91 /DNA_END=2217 /DNA_ORIENTATION=+
MSFPPIRRRRSFLLPTLFVVLFATSTLGLLRDGFTGQPRGCSHTRPSRYSCDGTCPIASASLRAEIGVGIDLGTTNSAIAFLDDDDGPCIIEIPNNGRTVKSVVAFDADSNALVGNEALDWELEHKETAYRHVKRVIGTSFNNLSDETRQVVPHLVPDLCGEEDFAASNGKKGNKKKKGRKKASRKKKKKRPSLLKILDNADNYPTRLFSLHGSNDSGSESEPSTISPEDVSSCVLQRLLSAASEHTGDTITRAVIGIPAYFNDAQKEATVRAAKACGIEKVKLLREPEAAALAYGFGKDIHEEDELVLVFDLGGGTYDVSVLTVGRGLTEIVCTSGNAQLGGTNFDHKIAKQISKWTGGCCKTEDSLAIVLKAAEAIRISLSNNRAVDLALPTTQDGWLALQEGRQVLVASGSSSGNSSDDRTGIDFAAGDDQSNSTHSFHKFTRKEFEKLCAKEFQDLIRPIREVAIMAGAMLPGDTRPSVAESALEREKELAELERFYYDEDEDEYYDADSDADAESTAALPTQEVPPEVVDFRSSKKAQQKGRKKAREVAKKERRFREESRKAQATAASGAESSSGGSGSSTTTSNAKVRADGISGRPISRIVLVGGATRMPTIGRIIASLTGVTPQKTVDPDEAVALGCAVHVGVLDGREEMGVVLNPMKAALLRAAIEKEKREGGLSSVFVDDDDDGFGDDDEFGSVEVIEF